MIVETMEANRMKCKFLRNHQNGEKKGVFSLMRLETGNVKILRLARRMKSVVFPEGVPIYRETVTVNELFDVIKCLRENYFNEQRCRNCAYYKFCGYPLRYSIHYYKER